MITVTRARAVPVTVTFIHGSSSRRKTTTLPGRGPNYTPVSPASPRCLRVVGYTSYYLRYEL